MKIFNFVLLSVIVACLSRQAFAASGWYGIHRISGACEETGGPADLIKSLQILGLPYKANDVTENGIVVETTIGDSTAEVTYYRGMARCEQATQASKEIKERELRKYDLTNDSQQDYQSPKPPNSSMAPATTMRVVSPQAVSVRSGPGPEYRITKKLEPYDIVTLYQTKSGWSNIGDGWVRSSLLVDESTYFDEQAEELMSEERIGNLHIGMLENEFQGLSNCTAKRGHEELSDATGEYGQQLNYTDCGISLDMTSEKKGSPKSISLITLTSPNIMATKRGIRIGSTEQEVMTAYKPFWNKDESVPKKMFLAGSIYGGLMFDFKNGKVSQIILGKMAE